MKERQMHNSPSPLEQEFLTKWMKGLQTYTSFNTNMNLSERKKAIKLSADVAIAATRNPTTRWSQAVMAAAATTSPATKTLIKQISGHSKRMTNALMIKYSHKILRRSRRTVILAKQKAKARRGLRSCRSVSMAKKMVKKRTRVLKQLVPGGHGMSDEACLIRETLDYIASLKVQVDVMKLLVGLNKQSSS